jgi:acyl-CoA synthetase (AMP-forming)/AMP-acid ligase II
MSSALIRRLEEHACSRPDDLAVREIGDSGEERCVTWRELRASAGALASRLRGCGRGAEVVLVVSPNRIELLVAMLGGLWADASVLPVSPELPKLELAATARRSRASIAIGEHEVLEALADAVPERIPNDTLAVRSPGDAEGPGASGGGSLLLTTSGTTGLPRLVRRDSPALDAVGASCVRAIGIDATDVMLVTVPLYHSYGIDQAVLTAVMAGCTIELHRRFDPAWVRSALLERGVSVLPAVPVMFDALARQAKAPGRAPRLRRAYSAGSPLPRRIFDQFARGWGVGLGQIYGATEFGPVTFNDPDAADFDPEVAGRPMRGVRLRILDARDPDPERPLPPEAEGQVAVAAPSMMRAYVGDARPPLARGFLLTGDLGRLDGSGRLRLTGRLRLLVDVGGIKVNPAEVESVLTRHPGVREAVVLAFPFSDTTTRLKAIVVPEPGCEVRPQELRRFAREHLIHYKVPRVFEIRTTMPRSATGKILREQLERECGLGAPS